MSCLFGIMFSECDLCKVSRDISTRLLAIRTSVTSVTRPSYETFRDALCCPQYISLLDCCFKSPVAKCERCLIHYLLGTLDNNVFDTLRGLILRILKRFHWPFLGTLNKGE